MSKLFASYWYLQGELVFAVGPKSECGVPILTRVHCVNQLSGPYMDTSNFVRQAL